MKQGEWKNGVALVREQEGDKYRIWREESKISLRTFEKVTRKHIII